MKSKSSVLIVVLLVLAMVETPTLGWPVARRIFFPDHLDRADVGRKVAVASGCFACHGANGSGGIANPEGKDGVVPALAGGELMMWAESPEELRHWILKGLPLNEQEQRSGLSAGQKTGRALAMPAYEGRLSDAQMGDLIAYIKSISGLQFPGDSSTAAGLEKIYELGCFNCHGPMGTGGVANPGSLKGYIPGFFGEDYDELVPGRSDLQEWITDGVSKAMADNPIAAALLASQAIKMPAYGEHLSKDEIDDLAAAVQWLAAGDWRNAKVP